MQRFGLHIQEYIYETHNQNSGAADGSTVGGDNIPSSCTVHWTVTLNSMFDVFPDTATTSDCIVGYRLATNEAVSFPCVLSSAASPNEKGQYNATDLGLEPVIVTPLEMLQNGQTNRWDKAWVGPDAIISEEDVETINVENGDGMALKEIHFTGVSYAQGVWGAFAPGKVVNFSCGNLVNLEKVVLPDDIEFLLPGQFTESSKKASVPLGRMMNCSFIYNTDSCSIGSQAEQLI